MINVVDEERLLFASWANATGVTIDEPVAPLPHSICQHAVLSRMPLVIENAREHPIVRNLPATKDLGVVGYLGVPLLSSSGEAKGTFCAIDSRPRVWNGARDRNARGSRRDGDRLHRADAGAPGGGR